MGLNNFWNNFSYGFFNGFFNSNPFMCGFGYTPFSFCCWSNPFVSNIFQYPSSMNYPPMFPTMPVNPFPTLSMPRVDTTSIFPTDIWNTQNNQIKSNNHPWLDSFERTASVSHRDQDETIKPAQNKIEKKATENIEKEQEQSAEQKNNFVTELPSTNKYADESKYDDLILKYSKKYGVDSFLVKAMIRQESAFKSSSVSSAGAKGLMQLMPATAKEMGVTNAFNPEQNIEGGVKYISMQLRRFNGDKKLALAAYNAGPGNVKNGKIPQNGETPKYVDKVLQYYEEYKALV